jgi:ammonia channel protein AmtB
MTSDPLLQLAAAAVVLAIPAGLLLLDAASLRPRFVSAAVAALAGFSASLSVDALLSSPSDLPARILDASFAAAIAASVALFAASRLGAFGGCVFASLWSLIVFQPVFAATVGSVPSLVQVVFGAVDFSAVLATHVAASASVIALTLLPRNVRPASPSSAQIPLPRALVAGALVIIGASAWLVGAERVLSDAVGRTVLNAVAGLLIGAAVWSLTERIAGRRFTPHGLVLGVLAAWGAIGLGAPFLAPTALVATAVIATAAAAAVVVRVPATAVHQRRIAISMIVAVAVGGVILALLADGFGLAATGSIALVLGQLGAVIAITIGALGSGLLCGGAALLAIVAKQRRAFSRKHDESRSMGQRE